MKKILFIMALLSFFMSNSARSELINGSTLSFTPLASGGVFSSLPVNGSGSWFSMEITANSFTVVPVSSLNGLLLGSTQLANSALPMPNGNIDTLWSFFGNIGAHQSTSDTDVLTAVGDMATIDFSGWSITWNEIPDIDMSTGAWNGNAEGVADLVCASGSSCSDGATFTLDYSALAGQLDPSAKGGVRYALHLEGVVSTIPVPAAVWLFGSGLIVLLGFSSHRKMVI